MNGEWIFQIALVLISAFVSALVGYFLGTRSQKIQALREYITGTVKDEYPSLFSEIKRNSKLLDNYLDKPDVNFSFPKLDQIYDRGLDEFMKRHHKDLFLIIDSFRKEILPKFKELNILRVEARNKLFDVWSKHLRKSLPKEVKDTSESIAQLLSKTINPYYVLPFLLRERDEEIRNKIERCILDETSHIYHEKSKRPYVIREQRKEINFDEISESLIEKAKPIIANFLEAHKELKKHNKKEVKKKLFPLLQKYISTPI